MKINFINSIKNLLDENDIEIIYYNLEYFLYKIGWHLYLIKIDKIEELDENSIINFLKDDNHKINNDKKVFYNKYIKSNYLKPMFPEFLKKTCYLIVYKENDYNRCHNLYLTILLCNKLFNKSLKIYIIEQDKIPKLNIDIFKNFKNLNLLFNKHEGFFNRSKAFNYGLNFIKDKGYENVILGDVDIPLEMNIFYLLPLLKSYYFINPYSGIYNTTQKDKKKILNGNKIFLNKDNLKHYYTFSGGVLLANFKKLKEINFFYEFDCYGNEDRILDVYLDTNNIPIYNDNFIYLHFYHDKNYICEEEKNKIKKNTYFLREFFGCTTGTLGKINFLKPLSNHLNCNHIKNNEIYEKNLYF